MPVAMTNELIKKLEPKEKVYDVRDSKQQGLYVRVEKSGTKTFRCQYARGKHYTIGRADSDYGFTVKTARELAQEIIVNAKKGKDPNEAKKQQRLDEQLKANQYTFAEFLEEKYLPWYKVTYPRSWHITAIMLRANFKPVFGRLPLSSITLEKVEAWRSKQQLERTRIRVRKNEEGKKVKIREPLSPATLNRYIERLSALLGKAVEYKCIPKNPLSGLKKLKIAQANRVRFLFKEEYSNLMKVLDEREEKMRVGRDQGNAWRMKRGYKLYPDLRKQYFVDHVKPMVLIALGSGVRFGSLSRLKWDKNVDITDGENIILKITPDIVKSQKGYEVPLDQTTSKVVWQWYEQTQDNHQGKGWVFPGKKPGCHITSIKKSWLKILELARIEDFTWHDQRHDFASQHAMSGTDLYTIMELLGHSDPKMTRRYAHLTTEHKVIAAQQLEKRRQTMLKK